MEFDRVPREPEKRVPTLNMLFFYAKKTTTKFMRFLISKYLTRGTVDVGGLLPTGTETQTRGQKN